MFLDFEVIIKQFSVNKSNDACLYGEKHYTYKLIITYAIIYRFRVITLWLANSPTGSYKTPELIPRGKYIIINHCTSTRS